MTIRVLHIFAPNYKRKFAGPIFDWKYAFSHWTNHEIIQLVLDPNGQVVDAQDAFNFKFGEDQYIPTRWERFIWIFSLLRVLAMNKGKYDLLHVHVLWWATLLAGLWAKMVNIPAAYQSVLLDEDTPGGILKEPFGKLKVWCLRKFKAILAISEFLASDYLKNGFSGRKVFTLMNSVDTTLFHPGLSKEEITNIRIRYNLPPNGTVCLFVGSLIRRKGIDLLIQAFMEAFSVNKRLFLVVIGPKNKLENPNIDESLVQELIHQIEKNEIEDRVYLPGLLQDRQELAEIYRASDIFVFPSRNEGLPNVVLEAMASQLPVVVSRLPGLEKVIKDKENGLFIPLGDSDSLKESILLLSCNPLLAMNIGSSARRYIEKNHSFLAWQAQVGKIYQGMIG